MKKTSKILIILIIVILLIVAGGVFTYIYLATDLLKSEQQLFFQYIEQLSAEEDGFISEDIEKFNENKKQKAFENTGDITVKTTIPEEYKEEINDEIIEKVNNLQVKFSGKSKPIEKIFEQNIEIDYGNNVVFPINYKQDGEIYGLQTKFVGSKYVSIENNNLKDLATKMGMDTSDIPNRIAFEQETDNFKFTPEEIVQLKETYGEILKEISKEHFSKVETQIGTEYILSLSGEETKNLLINLLERFKQDSILTYKINQFLQKTGQNLDITVQEQAQKLINELNEKDFSKINGLQITIGQRNKKLNQIVIEYDVYKVEIIKNQNTDTLNYIISGEAIIGDKNQNSNNDITKAYFKLNCIYNGISTLNNVKETYECTLGANADNEKLEYVYVLNNTVQFKDSVNIETLNQDTALILNDYESETINNLTTAIIERLTSVNKEQMQELGLQEDENPIIYSNPITMSGIIIYNMANEAINNSSLTDTEKQIYNSKFKMYEGEQSGSAVNALITTALNNNMSQTEENKKIRITLDGNEILGKNDTYISTKVDLVKKYKVTAIYDNTTELITAMNIVSE